MADLKTGVAKKYKVIFKTVEGIEHPSSATPIWSFDAAAQADIVVAEDGVTADITGTAAGEFDVFAKGVSAADVEIVATLRFVVTDEVPPEAEIVSGEIVEVV